MEKLILQPRRASPFVEGENPSLLSRLCQMGARVLGLLEIPCLLSAPTLPTSRRLGLAGPHLSFLPLQALPSPGRAEAAPRVSASLRQRLTFACRVELSVTRLS